MLNELKVVLEGLNYIVIKACSDNGTSALFFAFVTGCSAILASRFLLWKESSLPDWVLVVWSRRTPQYVNVGKIMHS